MSMPGSLSLSKNGDWLHDGKPVTHAGVSEYFWRYFRYSKELAAYVVEIDGKCVSVEIEDVPYVVRTIDVELDPWTLLFNDGSLETLQPETLEVNSDNIFYCKRANGEAARFSRAATQTLIPLVKEDVRGFFINCGARMVRLKKENRK